MYIPGLATWVGGGEHIIIYGSIDQCFPLAAAMKLYLTRASKVKYVASKPAYLGHGDLASFYEQFST